MAHFCACHPALGANRVLDCFLYHNKPTATPNCAPHVDRGFLHAIVASPVDGLQLQSRASASSERAWHAPHELWPEITPHLHVIVIVNDALQSLSQSWQQNGCGDGAGAEGGPVLRVRLSRVAPIGATRDGVWVSRAAV